MTETQKTEALRLHGEGKIYKEIGEQIGATTESVKQFFYRNRKHKQSLCCEQCHQKILSRTEERCRKAVKALAKADLLILDDWLLQPLTPQEVYDLLELVEARTKHGATIFCTQYETDDWYVRLNPTPGEDTP